MAENRGNKQTINAGVVLRVAVRSLTTPWRLQAECDQAVAKQWHEAGENGGGKEGKEQDKSQREGQVPASPVKHIGWVLSSRFVGCFQGVSTQRSDSGWGLFILTFKNCHNTFNTSANLRSPLGCLCLCKHAPLPLQHSKGHMSVFLLMPLLKLKHKQSHIQVIFCHEYNECPSCLAGNSELRE